MKHLMTRVALMVILSVASVGALYASYNNSCALARDGKHCSNNNTCNNYDDNGNVTNTGKCTDTSDFCNCR